MIPAPSLLALAVLWSALPLQDRPIETLFPASSYGVVQFSGLAGCKDAVRKLGVTRLGEAALARLGDGFLERSLGRESREAVAEFQRGLEQLGIDPRQLRRLLGRPMAFGFGRLTLMGNALVPASALLIDVDGAREEAERIARAFRSLDLPAPLRIRWREERIQGHAFRVLRSERAPGAIVMGFVDRYFLLSNSTRYVRDCLQTKNGEQPSLGRSAAFQSARRRLPGRPLASCYLNLEPFFGWTGPLLPYEADDISEALGIHELHGLYLATAASGRNSTDLAHLSLEGSAEGLFRSMLGRSVSLRAARYCPPDTMLFASVAADGSALLGAVEKLHDALPMEARRELARGLRHELGHLDLSPERLRQLLKLVGPELSLSLTQPGGRSGFPELMAFLELGDEQGAKGLLEGCLARSGTKHATTRFKGSELHYVSLRDQGLPFTPAFTFKDGMLLASSQLLILKNNLSRAAKQADSLAQDPRFRAAARSIQGASVFLNVRLESGVAASWNLVLPLLEGLLRQSGVQGLQKNVLPTKEEMQDAIEDLLITFGVDAHGATLQASQPLGIGVLLAVAGTTLDWVLGRVGTKRRIL
ncbi:MAG: hypothetical protein ACE5F1_06810 [Planctomycetota bacterium]